MIDVSLYDAWQLWLSGKSAAGTKLWGVPMIWWGRGGKIVSFIAAATVLLDVVGPERLKQYAERARREDKRHDIPAVYPTKVRRTMGCLFLLIVPPMIIFGLVRTDIAYQVYSEPYHKVLWPILLVGSGLIYLLQLKRLLAEAVSLFARVLEHRHLAAAVRMSGFIALALGFHFDLLAS
ncbi:hypothetical protein ABT158_21550 [Nonomuraea sp. NPDC001636]|uniref:hypothetical protein n=1 Tax=Nonomuraea sp. NPDC001636 TaxID=3154391 RepID=UPI00332F6F79